MSGNWPMSTVSSQIEKLANSYGYMVPRTAGVKLIKHSANLWSSSSLVNKKNGEPVSERFFWIERKGANKALKMGKINPNAPKEARP